MSEAKSDRCVHICISIPTKYLDALDSKCGKGRRSAYVQYLIAKELGWLKEDAGAGAGVAASEAPPEVPPAPKV